MCDAPAIITVDQFERVQRQLATRKRRQMPATRKGQIVSLTSGLLYCGSCGASYTVRGRKLRAGRVNTWYGCVKYAENGAAICGQRETISATRTNEALIARMRELLNDPTSIAAIADEEVPRCADFVECSDGHDEFSRADDFVIDNARDA